MTTPPLSMPKLIITLASVFLLQTITSVSGQQHQPQLQQPILPAYVDRFHFWEKTSRAIQSNNGSQEHNSATQALWELLSLSSSSIQEAVAQSLERSSSESFLRRQIADAEDAAQRLDSQLCANQSLAVLRGLMSGETWALSILDAFGKPRPGVTDGNLNWPGSYDLCKKVRGNTTVPVHPTFSGKYCTAQIRLKSVPTAFGAGLVPGLMLGVCVPDSCSAQDITNFVSNTLRILNISALSPGPATCVNIPSELDARAVVAIIICGIFGVLVILGTTLDIIYNQFPKWYPPSHKIYSSANGNPAVSVDENQPLLPTPEPKIVSAETGVCTKLLVSFSFYTNASKLLSTKQPPGSLTCVHGIRFLSMTWVVLGHAIMTPSSVGENIGPYFIEANKRWTFQAISNAPVSVDSFFVLSGLLVAYLTLKEMNRNGGKLNWVLFYVHRFWRLTPVYMMSLMIYVCLMPYWGEGPFWSEKIADEENCVNYWWRNLLYINNLFPSSKMCFGHSWYLANDMQFYILSPLIFVPFYFFPVAGAMVSVLFLLVTSITPAVITMKDELRPGIIAAADVNSTAESMVNYTDHYYFKPYCRMGAYVIGMLAGYFLYRTKCEWRPSRLLNLALWAGATACALAVLYGLYDACNGHPVSLSVSAFYNAVHRQVWSMCLAWVVVACCTGNGGFVNTLLSWPGLVPLSRLTYAIYLIHIMTLETAVLNFHSPFYYSDLTVVMFFLFILVISYMAAFVVSLVFEAPMMGLEKVLLNKLRSSHRQQNKIG